MDPVGGLASIVTLASTALAVSKIGVDLVQAFQDAPQELRAIVSKIRTIESQLEHLSQIGFDLRKTGDQLLSSQFSQTIQSALEGSKDTLTMLQNDFPSTKVENNRRSRLRWVLLERNKMNQHTRRLQQNQQDLGLALQILDMRTTLLLKDSVIGLGGLQSQLSEKVNCVQQKVEEICLKIPPTQQDIYTTEHFRQCSSRSASFCPYYEQPIKLIDYNLLKTIGQVSRGLLSIRNVVPHESRIMIACEQGDIPVVQQLLQTKTASPHDITRAGRTPLLLAIKSGDFELAKLLLDHNAEVNQSYGDYQMSPLQLAAQHGRLDIARLLLSKGSWGDHTDARGWTAAFYLWSVPHVQMPIQTSFLKVLNMDGAAAFGTAGDVEILIRYGSDPRICTVGLEWSSLYYSTLFSNEPTLRELMSSSHCPDINSSDVRGWTPLHVAAACRVANILSSLLELGADPYRLTKPTSFHVPEALQGKVLMPLDIAEEAGQEQHGVYVKALRAAGFEIDRSQAADTVGETDLI
ncbi:Ankyrin-1 [Lobaria immixta]|nr:Ankyrin-1 [Lobaria immixta]